MDINQENNFNNSPNSYLTNPQHGLVGGKNQESKHILQNIGKQLQNNTKTKGLAMEDQIDIILKKANRIDFPIQLDPKTSSFIDVALHAILRQRKKQSTVSHLIRYAKFMENHQISVDFRKPNYQNFIRHMDYREQIENAGYGALGREWDTMKMFLRAYGIPISD